MAKLQRWRRGRSAGEGTSPVAVEEVGGETTTVAEADESAEEPAGGPESTIEADSTDATSAVAADAAVEGAADDAEPSDDAGTEGVDEDAEPDEEPEDEPNAATEPATAAAPATRAPRRTGFGGWITRGTSPREWIVVTLLQAAHAKQAIFTALVVGGAAVAAGRPARESGVIVVTVLLGQTILGWHNDITDKARDQRHGTSGKPLADGRLETGTVWYAIVVAALALVPLAITTGITAGCIYLGSVAVGMLGNVLFRTGILSFWSWAVSYAMIPAYLSYGGWGGQALGSPPETSIVVLAGLLGVGIHFMRAVWGLVADHEDGWTYLPLKVGLKIGATRLLALSTLYVVVIAALLVVFGFRDGLSRGPVARRRSRPRPYSPDREAVRRSRPLE